MPEYYNAYSPAQEKRNGLIKTFSWMFFGLLITAATSYILYATGLFYTLLSGPIPLLLVIAQFGIVIAFSSSMQRASASTMKLLFIAYAITLGVSMTSICVVYGLGTVSIAFLVSAVYFACLVIIGFTTKKDLSKIGTLCIAGMIALILSQAIMLLFRVPGTTRLLSIVGLLIFTGLTAWDVQRANQLMNNTIGETQEKFAIFMALELYLDFINIFLYIVRLIGSNSNRN